MKVTRRKNYKLFLNDTERNTVNLLRRFGNKALRHTKPLTPKDTGYLRSLYNKIILRESGKVTLTIYNTASYAYKLHEGTNFKFRHPGTIPKFLKVGMREAYKKHFKSTVKEFF